LGPLFPAEKMDIVDQKKIGLTIAFAEFDQLLVESRR
jgi:hypothetical protein